jgi:hypothetical protein
LIELKQRETEDLLRERDRLQGASEEMSLALQVLLLVIPVTIKYLLNRFHISSCKKLTVEKECFQ